MAVAALDCQGSRRASVPGGVEAGPGPVAVRRGPGGRGRAGRNDRGRPGRVRAPRGPLAPLGRGSWAGRGPGAPGQGTAVPLPGRRGRSATPAVGPVVVAGRPGALDVAGAGPRAGGAGDCVPHPLRDGAPCAKKRTDALVSGPRSYPPVPEADFVIPRERVRDRYRQPYAARSGNRQDEQPQPLRAAPPPYDYAYVRHGPCPLWMCVESLPPTPPPGARAWTGRAR